VKLLCNEKLNAICKAYLAPSIKLLNVIFILNYMKQREIKFRVWEPGSKTMYSMAMVGEPANPSVLTEKHWRECTEKVVLMQYTGLKDKNGKEIYEGDIVRILYTDWASKPEDDPRTIQQYLIEDKCHIGKIVYNAPEFEINFGRGKYGDDDFGSTNHGAHGWIEVIGNVFENPELIQE
jgi:uncharacterized phage protein (TIGR01671 family)